ncbi:HDOD domain-containing protein [Actomonas aquatica]|uniref:HDOD domain-containing protein n=1 Tax=Actomonas aquatica TaxID=2866162 RepID=A0ABZ1CC86_9BACT|nr:HDOD domain-containing protein [Opitutus sp. WL0086]WRQ89293.1 HDOD domain-containing protein [Opitutus sp. WL0086]
MSQIPSLDQVCERALKLPCSPSLMPRLISALDDEETGIEEIGAIIQLDAALAGSTLRLANSAFFGGGEPVDTLNSALMRLGIKEIYRLSALALVGRWFNQEIAGYGWQQGDFCRLSLVTAVAAEYLAETTGVVDPGKAYAAGLVHEIGKMAVAYSCADYFGDIRTHQREHGVAWAESERAILGYCHIEAGAELLRRWNFPPNLIAPVEHNPPSRDVPEEDMPLVMVVHAAKYVATSIGAGVAEDGFLFDLQADLLDEWNLNAEVLEKAFPIVLERSERMLHDRMTTGEIEL